MTRLQTVCVGPGRGLLVDGAPDDRGDGFVRAGRLLRRVSPVRRARSTHISCSSRPSLRVIDWLHVREIAEAGARLREVRCLTRSGPTSSCCTASARRLAVCVLLGNIGAHRFTVTRGPVGHGSAPAHASAGRRRSARCPRATCSGLAPAVQLRERGSATWHCSVYARDAHTADPRPRTRLCESVPRVGGRFEKTREAQAPAPGADPGLPPTGAAAAAAGAEVVVRRRRRLPRASRGPRRKSPRPRNWSRMRAKLNQSRSQNRARRGVRVRVGGAGRGQASRGLGGGPRGSLTYRGRPRRRRVESITRKDLRQ